jgi:serine/threonine-protein phosphatase 4 regulatory subunit 1
LAHDDFDEHRATAVSVLHELAPALGCDLCRSFLSHELVAMSEDPSFRVRKATAAAFSNICQTVGPEYAVQRLLPAFLKLSKDSIWGVRKACVDNMIGIANCMSLSVRMSVFVPIFEQFSKDVRISKMMLVLFVVFCF